MLSRGLFLFAICLVSLQVEGHWDNVKWSKEATVLKPGQYQVHGMVAAYRELIDVIRVGGESISSPHHARMSLQIMLGFLDSHRQGSRFVDVPG